jgi:NAD-dependent deacetylase
MTSFPAPDPAPGPSTPMSPELQEARDLVSRARTLFFLTGAGVSAESGVPTFRGAVEAGGTRFRPEALATPEAFAADPVAVWAWYDARRAALTQCRPNPGHLALARVLETHPDAHLATQNVDGLHTRASAELGAPVPHPCIHELHGSLARLQCSDPGCGWAAVDPRRVQATGLGALPRCPRPGCGRLLRPGVVWFGEALPEAALEAAFEAAARADICIVAGTSAVVHPAASLPLATLRGGGVVVEVNLEPTPLSPLAGFRFPAPSGILLPQLLAGVGGREDPPSTD